VSSNESGWTLGNKCSAKGSPFQSEEPTIKGSSAKMGAWSNADTCGHGVVLKLVLFIIPVCFADALYG